jgi:hypothetical protein
LAGEREEAKMLTGRVVVLTVGMLAASVWVGSLVALAVVSAVARGTLDGSSRVALFRGVGRAYQFVGTGSLVAAVAAGLALAWPLSDRTRGVVVEFTLASVLLVVTLAGMAQARKMTVARRRSLVTPGDRAAAESVHRGARVAGILRGLIAVVTLVMIVLGAGLLDEHLL